MSKVIDGNFVVIQSWMLKEMKLKGNELLVYAIIYGFSQDGEQEFTGSLQYLADWTNSTKQGVIKNLNSLITKGYIEKHESFVNGVKFCSYKSVNGIKQSLMGYSTEFNEGSKQSLPNNITNNIDDNIDIPKPKTVGTLISGYTDNEDLQKALMDFAKMRKTIKNPLTQRAMELLFDKLDKLATDDNTKIEILNQSIMNNWKGVFELKETKKQSKPIPQKRVSNIDHHIANYDSQAYRDRANSIENYQYKKRNS